MQALSLREIEDEAAFARIGLVPRVLCGGGTRELAVTLLVRRAALPVVAPTALIVRCRPPRPRT